MPISVVSLEAAAEIMGPDWPVENLINAIIDEQLPGYLKIIHRMQTDPYEMDDDDNGTYVIGRIITLTAKSKNRFMAEYIPTTIYDPETEFGDIAAGYINKKDFDKLSRLPRNTDVIYASQLCVSTHDIASLTSKDNVPSQLDIQKIEQEDFVSQLRKQGANDSVIAVLLNEKYPNANDHDLMKLIDRQRVEKWEQTEKPRGRPKQWFQDLMTKGKKHPKR